LREDEIPPDGSKNPGFLPFLGRNGSYFAGVDVDARSGSAPFVNGDVLPL
jgi:hypothetical protein